MEFYDCLHRLNSTVSNHIGELHFTYNYRCYRSEFEIQKCNEFEIKDINNKRCVQYFVTLRTPFKNQWFDLPFYSGQPMKRPVYVMKEVNSNDEEEDEEEAENEEAEENEEEEEEEQIEEQEVEEEQEEPEENEDILKTVFLDMNTLGYSLK